MRDYSRVRNYASLSYTYAEKAMNLSRERINATEELLNFRISLLETRLKNLLGKYGKVPLDAERQNHYRKSEMLLTEGRYAYKQGNYQSAKEKLDISETMIQELSEYYEDILFQYFGQRPQWNQWIDFVVRDSRRNKTACVVIDKIARKCVLYKNGKAVNTFDAELGSNWIGDKSQQGDKTTPEGLYKIELKKAGGETRYYKALLLDYPNEEDKKRFILNKRNNVIRQDAKIGSLIEIHGGGGKGIDWRKIEEREEWLRY